MIIDAHAHAYRKTDLPMLVERTARLDSTLADDDPNKWMLRHEGSIDALIQEEERAGIDRFVLLPISARPEKTRELNRWAAEKGGATPRIIPFGTLVASSSTLPDDLEEAVSLGVRGIKIHPFLQRLDILSDEAHGMWRLIDRAGLPVMLDSMYLKGLARSKPHLREMAESAGEFETGPERIGKLAAEYPGLTIISPHLGSLYGWDRLDPLYPLENVYFDLSFVSSLVPGKRVVELVRRKGCDRVLFGTDAPWRSPFEVKAWFEALPFTDEERELMAWKNAETLFSDRHTGEKPSGLQ